MKPKQKNKMKIKTKQKHKMKIKTKQKNKMKIEPKQKNNQKDYTKTMSISRNCQNGVRLARPTNPVFFWGQSVGVSGGVFFFGVQSVGVSGQCFFLALFCCFSGSFLFFFGFVPEKKTRKEPEKKTKKKGVTPLTRERRAASRPTPPHSALEKFGAC